MSICENCIHIDCTDDGLCRCMKGHIVIMIQNNCEDYEHWNNINGDDP